jgi:alkylation response protein AidB-like acyl-CoA dehydrogenase
MSRTGEAHDVQEHAAETDAADGRVDEVRRSAGEWVAEHWHPDMTVRQWWAALAESGWGFPTWPTDWFGRGLPSDVGAAVLAQLAAAGAIGPPAGIGQVMAGPLILEFGSDDQKRQFLPRLVSGEESWCQFFSEPGAGSDLAGLQTRATRDGDEWVVNGQKLWSGGAMDADHAILLARTDPDQPKHKGISYMVIDTNQPGIEIRPIRQMDGEAHFNEIFFTDARVPDVNIVGGLNNGWPMAVATLAHERTAFFGGGAGGFGSVPPGAKAGMLDRPVGDVVALLASRRREEGAALSLGGAAQRMIELARSTGHAADPVVRQRLAQLYAAQEAARFTAMRARAAAEAGRPPGAESSVGKLIATRNARLVRDLGPELLGPYGTLVSDDAPDGGATAATTLYTPCLSIMGGTDEIQKNIVGERVLGLPREPQVDRDVPFRELLRQLTLRREH